MKKLLFSLLTVLLATLAAQAATDYGFSVAGTTVTSDNCSNITSSYITSGTVTYDPSNNTLFMYNVTINMTGSYNRCINNLENSDLIVMFRGTCNLKAQDASVIRIRKSTTLWAPQATDVVNITGVNDVGIWMATSNDFDLTIWGPGTFNISSTKKPAIEDEDNSSGIILDTWHEVYFDNVNAVLSSGENSVAKRVLLRFKAGSSVRFKATNNSSYPVINYCGWQLYGNETLLEPYGAYYSGNTVKDSNGNSVYNQDVYVSDDYVAIINATNFPDANFRSYMLGLYSKGYITQTDVNNCTSLNIGNKSISNLQGIEYFTNLTTLYLNNNNLTSLSRLSGLTKLTYLNCNNNQLTSLDLSSFPNLQILACSNNKLTTLNAYNKSSLKTIVCSNNTLLTTILCYNDNLTTLDVTNCPALQNLRCYENANLTAITGLANCTAITYLDCEDCAITSLSGVDNMTNIGTLLARNNKLTTLCLDYKTNLTRIRVSGNQQLTDLQCLEMINLETLDVTNCIALKSLECYRGGLSSITGLGTCTALTYLDCSDSYINDLSGLTNLTNLKTLYCEVNKLTSLNVQGLSKLETIYCNSNQLTTLSVQGCTALTKLYCYRNKISGTGMTTLVNSLPTRSASAKGTLRAIDNSSENNSMTATQITTARNKYWLPYRFNGSSWVEMTASTRGDVDGDGNVNISDVTALINYLLSGNAASVDVTAADCDQDGNVNISDVTTLINYLLSGNW